LLTSNTMSMSGHISIKVNGFSFNVTNLED
jgi:hypothetical protein